jgi:hypothetical protein
VTITPASVSIAATQGTTSAMTNVVVTNSGNAPLHISGVTYGGANVAEFVNPGNPCAAAIAPNGSCTISVGFAPMAASGSASENISITSDAANSPQIVTVTGTASPAFALTSAATALMASVTAGQTATYNLQLVPGAGYSGNISMACSGAPSHSTCAVTPNPVALTSGNAANFTVNIATTASSFLVPNSARRPISIPPMPAPNFLGWTLAFSIVVMATLYQRGDRRRFGFAFTSRQFAYSGFAIVILMAYGLAGCATGGNSTAPPPPTQSGTPQGTYTITLTPAASSMTGQPLQTAALAIHLTLTVK